MAGSTIGELAMHYLNMQPVIHAFTLTFRMPDATYRGRRGFVKVDDKEDGR